MKHLKTRIKESNIMRISIYVLLFLSIINCQGDSTKEKAKTETTEKAEIVKPKIPYLDFLTSINLKKLSFSEKKKRFFTFINKDIPSYWTGTKWDFNGVTRTPQNGEISCGYFVTNTLKDFGMKLKRIWLAQQASSVMIKELCAKNSVKRYSKISQVKNYLKNQGEKEVFIVGLDFHTGYIIKDGSKYYFLHSNFINREGVMKENINESRALLSSKTFMIGSLTQNDKLF